MVCGTSIWMGKTTAHVHSLAGAQKLQHKQKEVKVTSPEQVQIREAPHFRANPPENVLVFVCIYISIYKHTYTYHPPYIHTYVHVSTYVYMCVCDIYMYLNTYIYMYTYIQMYAHVSLLRGICKFYIHLCTAAHVYQAPVPHRVQEPRLYYV